MYGGQKYRKQNLTFGLPGERCEKMKLGELQPLTGRSPLCNSKSGKSEASIQHLDRF